MYYIDRIDMTDATFLSGSVEEPSATETEWVSGGTYAVGDERIRSSLHRVFKCAAPRSPSTTPASTVPPEGDPTGWVDMRPTDRYLPFGPMLRSDGLNVYQSKPLIRDDADIEYRLGARFANSIAMFGMAGAAWQVQVFDEPGGNFVTERTGNIVAPATGFWDYAFGKRRVNDRVLITDLPMFPLAEIRIKIMGGVGATRKLSQCEVGSMQQIHGADFGGVEYGVTRDPRINFYEKEEKDGSVSILIYNSTYDLSGTVVLAANDEDEALIQWRNLLGKGIACTPTLQPGFQQSLVFAMLTKAPTSRDNFTMSKSSFTFKGLPT